jgi:D-alanine-D-alanine ligase-like ATP-grasp enzyme
MSKLRVAILQGGPSPEREVSLRSGQMVLKNLDPSKYEAFAVDLSDLLGSSEAIVALKAKADFVFLAVTALPAKTARCRACWTSWACPTRAPA